jgi:hypothetical protein
MKSRYIKWTYLGLKYPVFERFQSAAFPRTSLETSTIGSQNASNFPSLLMFLFLKEVFYQLLTCNCVESWDGDRVSQTLCGHNSSRVCMSRNGLER